jgi:hypothetical protein
LLPIFYICFGPTRTAPNQGNGGAVGEFTMPPVVRILATRSSALN